MAASKSEKDYWVKKLSDSINHKINQLAIQKGENVIEKAKEAATLQVMEKAGVLGEYKQEQELNEHINALEVNISKLREQRNALSNKVYNVLKGERRGYWDSSSIIEESIKDIWIEELTKYGPAGNRILDLLKQRESIEINIMFATSSKTLVEFVKRMCDQLGIEVS